MKAFLNLNWTERIITLALLAAIVFGFYGALWLAWCWVLPQVWSTGPQAFIRPGYWFFIILWTLVTLVGRALFGRSK